MDLFMPEKTISMTFFIDYSTQKIFFTGESVCSRCWHTNLLHIMYIFLNECKQMIDVKL